MKDALPLDPHVVGGVHHDLRDGVVGQQPLERSVAQDVVRQLLGEPLAVLARDACLLGKATVDLLDDPRPQRALVDVAGEYLATQILDHTKVDAVLDIGERVSPALRDLAHRRRGKTLM